MMEPTKRWLLAGLALLLSAPSCLASDSRRRTFSVPPGYALVAGELGIPPAILYGVALQESAMLFGESGERRPLPWPWTLNIAGSPARLATRAEAESHLYSALQAGIESVDVGPMGINWRWHKERLRSVRHALEPYWNLRVGASLLAGHFRSCGDWTMAVGRYHAPANEARAASYSALVFARLRRLGHA